jgi:protocatechuate 3,4-dioxygenase alpha subunit
MEKKQTPSQTVGPYLSIGLIYGENQNVLVNERTKGQRIRVLGMVTDGNGEPVPDAMIEIWQADANGYFNHEADPRRDMADPHFRGFGRAENRDGAIYSFKTIKPGVVPFDDEQDQAPHINVRVFARGMLTHAYTRLYFADEEEANKTDPILNLIDVERRSTLIAQLEPGEDLPTYCFNIQLQGGNETVFFNP